MLSEERVVHMTRMAMDEEKNADLYTSVININKKDYLSWYGLVSFLLGTVTYVTFFGVIVAALLHIVLDNITTPLLVMVALLAVIGYLLYLYIYMGSSRKWAKKRYEAGKKALHRRIADWDRLEEIYLEEEENKSPTMSLPSSEGLPVIEETVIAEGSTPQEPRESIVVLEPVNPKPEGTVTKPEETPLPEPVMETAIERLQRQRRERKI